MTMLKPKKPQPEDSSQNAGRVRLPIEEGIRPPRGIRELLEQAREKQGTQFELPWTTTQPGQRFILTVKWEKGQNDPIWTLYEETASDSRIVWSQPFAPTDMDFMYDVLSMSAGSTAVADKEALADLKPSAEQLAEQEEILAFEKANGGKPAPPGAIKPRAAAAPATPAPAQPAAPPPQAAPPAPVAPPPNYAQPAPGYPPQGAPVPPGYMYPPPMQAPPGYPQQPMPYVHPSQMPYAQPPAQAFPPPQAPPQPYQPPAPQPAWNYGSPSQGSAAGSIAAALPPSIDPVSDRSPKVPVEMDLRNKRPGILLGALLTEAGLITEPTLEAALKIQEFVNDGRLDVTRGPELLKLFYSMGAAIEEYIDPTDLISPAKRQAPPPQQNRPNQAPPTDAPRSSNAPGANKDLSAALELLTKSGILTDSDIKTANGVRAKHGGDVRMILQAAGKVDAKTMDAALTCIALERDGAFKFEQAVIALNYCSRSRVGFDEALEEMGWPNPRKRR